MREYKIKWRTDLGNFIRKTTEFHLWKTQKKQSSFLLKNVKFDIIVNLLVKDGQRYFGYDIQDGANQYVLHREKDVQYTEFDKQTYLLGQIDERNKTTLIINIATAGFFFVLGILLTYLITIGF